MKKEKGDTKKEEKEEKNQRKEKSGSKPKKNKSEKKMKTEKEKIKTEEKKKKSQSEMKKDKENLEMMKLDKETAAIINEEIDWIFRSHQEKLRNDNSIPRENQEKITMTYGLKNSQNNRGKKEIRRPDIDRSSYIFINIDER